MYNLHQINYVFGAVTLLLITMTTAESFELGGRLRCSEVRRVLEKDRSGIILSEFPSSDVNELELEFCRQGPSCCNKETEKALGDWSKTEFILQMQGHTSGVVSSLKLYATQLENFVEEMLQKVQKNENDFFRKTYGIFYTENQGIFNRYWEEIRNYYAHGRTDLVDVTYTFFSELYQKMFQAMNAQYVLDEQYMECVAETMNTVVPFNDSPKRLAMSLRRSMVAVRALSKSLKDAIEVLVQLGDASEPSSSCYKALQSMHTCPACMGLSSVKPCPQLCIAAMQSCMSRHLSLQGLWDDFINSTDSLADRILRPFNLETVMYRRDISISEAIMDFQYRSAQANKKVLEICGTPKLVKRSAETGSQSMTGFVFEAPSEASSYYSLFHQDTPFYRIIEEIRGVLSSTKGFWKSLPAKLCEGQISESSIEKCWNGLALENLSSVDSNSVSSAERLLSEGAPVKQEAGGEDLLDNIGADEEPMPSVFHEKKFRLQSVLNQVKLATGGQDVEWFDQESDFEERFQLMNTPSGSGDFVGSGEDIFNNGIFSGGGLDLEEPSSGDGGDIEDNWNEWNPFSTTIRSDVEMDVEIVEASSSISIHTLTKMTAFGLELLITSLIL